MTSARHRVTRAAVLTLTDAITTDSVSSLKYTQSFFRQRRRQQVVQDDDNDDDNDDNEKEEKTEYKEKKQKNCRPVSIQYNKNL